MLRKNKIGRRIIIVVATVWFLLLGGAFGYIWALAGRIQHDPEVKMHEINNENLSVEIQEMMKGYWTIAVFGVDSRDGNLGKGARSDMEMVCNVNLDTGEIKIVSIYRDTYVKIGADNNYDKINEAYAEGGVSQAIEAINENLDLNVDDYASFNWKAVVDTINLLGGIDLEISQSEFKVINGFITETVESTGVASSHLKQSGMNHLDGVQAVAYVRLRKMDTDFKRTRRQRLVAQLVLEKAKKADFSVLNNILVTVLPQISTSMGYQELTAIATNSNKFYISDSTGFPFELTCMKIGKRDCVIPTTLEMNVKKLHQFLFEKEEYEPSSAVKNISKKIEMKAAKP